MPLVHLTSYGENVIPAPIPPEEIIYLSLTYDENDYWDTMTWASPLAGPLVTPDGLEGDRASAVLQSTTIPTGLQPSANEVSLAATLRISKDNFSSGSTAPLVGLYNTSGTPPPAKLAIVCSREFTGTSWSPHRAIYLTTYTTGPLTYMLCRQNWYYMGAQPELSPGGNIGLSYGLFQLEEDIMLYGVSTSADYYLYKMRISTWEVLGECSWGSAARLYSWAKDASGNAWALALADEHLYQIDIDTSFATGTIAYNVDYDVSAFTSPYGLAFAEINGSEHFLVADYQQYLYATPVTAISDGGTFVLTDRYKRLSLGSRATYGCTVLNGNFYYIWWEYGVGATLMDLIPDIDSIFVATAEDTNITTSATHSVPSAMRRCFNIYADPTSGNLYALSRGWSSDNSDQQRYNGMWKLHSPTDPAETGDIDIAIHFKNNAFTITQNNRPMGASVVQTPSVGVNYVAIGGPVNPTLTRPTTIGDIYDACLIKNVAIKQGEFTDEEYDNIRTGAYETRTLTTTEVTLTNPGAETGDTTGWTVESGGLALRTGTPAPHSGTYYFLGSGAQDSVARQRINVLSEGISASDIATGKVWAKVRWWQTNYAASNDAATLALRTLDNTPTQLTEDASIIDDVTPQAWMARSHTLLLDAGTNYVDVLIKEKWLTGTGTDGYIDDITLTLYARAPYTLTPLAPVFYAITYNTSTLETVGVKTGAGDMLVTHSGSMYIPDNDGVFQLRDAGDPMWVGAQYAGSPVTIYVDTGSPPVPLTLKALPASFTVSTYYSNDLTQTSNWAYRNNWPTRTFDQVGLDGRANTATVVNDFSATENLWIGQRVAITANTDTHTVRFFIKKDATLGSVFPEVHVRYPTILGGSGLALGVNLDTGATAARIDTAGCNNVWEVRSTGDWWEIIIQSDNVSESYIMYGVMPRASTTLGGGLVVSLTGPITVGNVECYLNKTIAEVRGLPVSITTTSYPTNTASATTFDLANHSNTSGLYYIEWTPYAATGEMTGNQQIISLNDSADLLYYDPSAGALKSTDDTNTATANLTVSAGTTYKIVVVYGDSKMRIGVNTSWGAEATYDGSFTTDTSITICNDIGYVADVANLRRWNTTYEDALARGAQWMA